MLMRKWVSVEQAHVRLGMTCRKCSQLVEKVPDFDKPARYYPQGIDNAGKCFVIAYPVKPHPSGLCFFHRKQSEGYFNRPYKPKQYGIEGGKYND